MQRDVAEVRQAHVLDIGGSPLRQKPDEKFVPVPRFIRRAQLRHRRARQQLRVTGRQNAPVHREQVRHKRDGHFPAEDGAERLLHFRRVAVARDFVSRHAFVQFREMRVLRGLPARARHAGGTVRNNSFRADKPRFQRRGKRQRHRRRVAPRIRHQLFPADFLAEQLRQAVGRFFVQLRILKRPAVPGVVVRFAFQPEIRSHVDKSFPRVPAPLRNLLRKPARQCGENDVALRKHRVLRLADHVAQPVIRRINFAERFPLKADRTDGSQLHLRVARQQPHQLRARVAGRPDDARADHAFAPSRASTRFACASTFSGAGPPSTFLPFTQCSSEMAS